ncbi:MAG TPA: heme-binding protein, partial [Symbiobacteriaceae bacterium]|nr:heme-binding protein [Symbiobacteriaceae bacterium]
AWITQFERAIDAADGELPPQTDWILPGATPGSGALHVARVTCRRAERAAVALLEQEEPSGSDTAVLQYLNRLSDYLHILARLEDHRTLVRRVAERVRAELDPTLTEADCDRILAAAEARARAIGVPMVIAVVDAGGNLKLFKRMDGALLASVDIAVNKAYTSAAVRLPTREVGKLAQPGAPLFGIESSGRIVAFAGGVPISRAGAVVGGLGVSGGTVEQDEDVAMAGLNGLI